MLPWGTPGMPQGSAMAAKKFKNEPTCSKKLCVQLLGQASSTANSGQGSARQNNSRKLFDKKRLVVALREALLD